MDAVQSRTFQAIHEVLADRAARAWSEKMRGKIDVRVTKVARPSFGEFAFGLDNPTCFLTLDIPPFAGRACLEFHPTVLFPMIDRLLGGGKKAGPIVRRPLTEIETRLLGRLTSIFFEQFRCAWRPFAAISPEVSKIESNPKLSRCVPAADPVEAVEFEINMPFARGPIRLAYPSSSLVAVYGQLSGSEPTPLGDARDNAEVRVLISQRSLEIDAPEHQLEIGDILATGIPVTSLAEVHIDGQARFLGRLGQHLGQKAIRLEENSATGTA
jgi:flagellar motor switch protein FliM